MLAREARGCMVALSYIAGEDDAIVGTATASTTWLGETLARSQEKLVSSVFGESRDNSAILESMAEQRHCRPTCSTFRRIFRHSRNWSCSS
ncbi:MAG: hypothetical protein MHM6MM_004345 [Cercozoa sp. M6MM]